MLDLCLLVAQMEVKRIDVLEAFGGAAGKRCRGFSAFGGFNEESFVQARIELKSIALVLHVGRRFAEIELKRIHVIDCSLLVA